MTVKETQEDVAEKHKITETGARWSVIATTCTVCLRRRHVACLISDRHLSDNVLYMLIAA